MGSAHWSGGRTPGFYPCRGDQSLITMATAEDLQKKSEMNDQLREYISQWRDERSKEEAELKRLKDKQAARKEIRAEQEKKQAAQKRAEEEKIKREEQEKKEAEAGGREEKAGDARRSEGGRQEVLWTRDGRSQRDVQVQGAGREAEAAVEEQGDQEGSRPRVLHPEAPPHHSHVLQVRAEDRHQDIRRPQEAVRGWSRGYPR